MPKSESSRGSTRSSRTLQDRIIDTTNADNTDPVRFIASCLFYSVHVANASQITGVQSLGGGAHNKLEINMYDTANALSETGFDYAEKCYKLYCSTHKMYMTFDQFIEHLLHKFADSRLLKKMDSKNYSKLFRSIMGKATSNYIQEVKQVSRTLYAYMDIDVYSAQCINIMHEKLITAIELSVHLLVDQAQVKVPLYLYESVKAERDDLYRKYQKLSKKYRRLKAGY